MKTYKVAFYYEESGHTLIEANSEEEAEEKTIQYLEDEGLDNLSYKCQDRKYDTVGIELIKESEWA